MTRTLIYKTIYNNHFNLYLETSPIEPNPAVTDKASREANIIAVKNTEVYFRKVINKDLIVLGGQFIETTKQI